MGHLTSRFGRVSPQGKVIGWEISSIAVGLEESSPMFRAKRIYFSCVWTEKSRRFQQVRNQEKWATWQRQQKEGFEAHFERMSR